jgi:hypothetical protein
MTTDSETATMAAEAPRPEPPNHRWSRRQVLLAATVAICVAITGTVVVFAARGSSTGAELAVPGGRKVQFPGDRAQAVPGGGLDLSTVLHGEFIATEDKTGYPVMLFQTGTVTEVSGTSITVRSTDGYQKSYLVDAAVTRVLATGGDITAVQIGQTVTVVARKSGDTATAESIVDEFSAPDQPFGQDNGRGAPKTR